jgi:hypothetical protein
MEPTTPPLGGGTPGPTPGSITNREQMKKMSDADKEMELRANRAKALLAERHVGLKAGQVRPIFLLQLFSNWSRPQLFCCCFMPCV